MFNGSALLLAISQQEWTMRMRLKYMIGGALLSLATLAASGPANAIVINENPATFMGFNKYQSR